MDYQDFSKRKCLRDIKANILSSRLSDKYFRKCESGSCQGTLFATNHRLSDKQISLYIMMKCEEECRKNAKLSLNICILQHFFVIMIEVL